MINDRLYDLLALFDVRDDTPLAVIVRAAREGYERADMGESGAWDEFDALWANWSRTERLVLALDAFRTWARVPLGEHPGADVAPDSTARADQKTVGFGRKEEL